MAKYNLRDNNGTALVETALILPTLTLMLIGAAEMGRIGYAAIEVTNAARAAVAVGAQSTQTAQAAQTDGSMQTAATADAPDLSALTLTPGSSCVCEAVNASTGAVNQTAISVCSGDSSTIPTQCGTSITPGVTNFVVNYVQASTTATVKTMFRYPAIPSSFTLHGSAKMRVEQQ